jgi:hypothetical protein
MLSFSRSDVHDRGLDDALPRPCPEHPAPGVLLLAPQCQLRCPRGFRTPVGSRVDGCRRFRTDGHGCFRSDLERRSRYGEDLAPRFGFRGPYTAPQLAEGGQWDHEKHRRFWGIPGEMQSAVDGHQHDSHERMAQTDAQQDRHASHVPHRRGPPCAVACFRPVCDCVVTGKFRLGSGKMGRYTGGVFFSPAERPLTARAPCARPRPVAAEHPKPHIPGSIPDTPAEPPVPVDDPDPVDTPDEQPRDD